MRNEILKYQRIRDMRTDRGISQQEVAEYLHVKQNTYSQYEIGVSNYPIEVVRSLALYYGTSTDYLLELTDDPAPHERSAKK